MQTMSAVFAAESARQAADFLLFNLLIIVRWTGHYGTWV